MSAFSIFTTKGVSAAFHQAVEKIAQEAPDYIQETLAAPTLSFYLAPGKTEESKFGLHPETANDCLRRKGRSTTLNPKGIIYAFEDKNSPNGNSINTPLSVIIGHELMHAFAVLYRFQRGDLSHEPSFQKTVKKDLRAFPLPSKAPFSRSAEAVINGLLQLDFETVCEEVFAETGRLFNVELVSGQLTSAHDLTIARAFPKSGEWVHKELSMILAAPTRSMAPLALLARFKRLLLRKGAPR